MSGTPVEEELRRCGYLARGCSLADVIDADEEHVASLGLTVPGIASALEQAMVTALVHERNGISTTRIGPEEYASSSRFEGMLVCPFRPTHPSCGYGFSTVFLRSAAHELTYSEIDVHLIRDHSFFGGPGTRRLDPEYLAAALHLHSRVVDSLQPTMSMPRVSFMPNATAIQARILATEPAEDGWGAWADVEVISSVPEPGSEKHASLRGKRLRVFVPPPLVDTVEHAKTFEGELTYNASPQGGLYALRRRR